MMVSKYFVFGLLLKEAAAFTAVTHSSSALTHRSHTAADSSSSALQAISVEKTKHTLYYVESINQIKDGKPQWSEEIDAYTLTNNKGMKVTGMPRGANLCDLTLGDTNYVWENKAGGAYYGPFSNSFPLSRGLILNGGVRFAAVTAEHGLYYDTDWEMSTDVSGEGEASIIFRIQDTMEQRFKVKDPFSVGQFNRADGAQSTTATGRMTKYPVTNMIFTFKITLKDDEDFVRLSMTIENPTSKSCNAEAWVPMTFPIDKNSQILSRQKTRWNKRLYHGCTIDKSGKGIVYYAPEGKPHYTKMWGWGNPDNFVREEAEKNDPLAAGRPATEYYEPWSSGFNFAFFQTAEFKSMTRYNWEIALVPIPDGLENSKTLEEKLEVVDNYIEARIDSLSTVADVTETPIE
ncbi:hypothetical protein FisN_9Lh315 [Fistulifera solaris]|uniref:Uncharacterized protein n=1 Tax=Fistulifera solaris TaxID=1519565 RepID=A0A1Z5KLR2_FISSO|nr:hypothetical protein FisN_9Lh315 [Fistulifera solaris]|eukprot:GAX27002.1 hypothetical protein FisN_9Lh315 [Fistulifera solaris]